MVPTRSPHQPAHYGMATTVTAKILVFVCPVELNKTCGDGANGKMALTLKLAEGRTQ